MQHFQVLAAAQLIAGFAEHYNRVAAGLEAPTQYLAGVLEQAYHSEHRRRIDRLAVRFVVEADVAAGDGDVKRSTGSSNTFDRPSELPHDLWPLGITEI